MKIFLETTTGRLVPDGLAADLAKGGTQPVELQFLTNGVAGLLPGETAISLDVYDPSDLETPAFSIDAWTPDEARNLYTGTVNTLAAPLAWIAKATYIANVTYGAEESDNFHLRYGAAGDAAPGRQPKVIVPPPGPKRFTVPLTFSGDFVAGQPFGMFKAVQDGRVVAAQLSSQDAPTGGDAKVDLLLNGALQNLLTTLTAGNKTAPGDLGTPLMYVAGDVIRAQITQIGSTLPGAWLTVNLVCENLSED